VLINEFGAVPINAGLISGRFGVADGDGDPGFGVCPEARPQLTSKQRRQKIRSRMAE
jgi:hypothetical protein